MEKRKERSKEGGGECESGEKTENKRDKGVRKKRRATPSLEREGWGELTRPITEQLLNLWSKEIKLKH